MSLYCHCMIPVCFSTRTSDIHDPHLHVLARLQEVVAVCCSVQEQLAETHCFQCKKLLVKITASNAIYNLNL